MVNYTDIPAGDEATSLLIDAKEESKKVSKKDFYLKVACAVLLMVIGYMVGTRSSTFSEYEEGSLIAAESAVETSLGQKECPQKLISLREFCASDYDPGYYEEHEFYINNKRLNSDLVHVELEKCEKIDVEEVLINKAISLSVGTSEIDTTSGNDNYFTNLNVNEWYDKTCDEYDIKVDIPYKHETQRKFCWTMSGKYKSISSGIEDCSTWTEPEKSYRFVLSVRPLDNDSIDPNVITTLSDLAFQNTQTGNWLGYNKKDYAQAGAISRYNIIQGENKRRQPVESGGVFNLRKATKYLYETSEGNAGFHSTRTNDTFRWKITIDGKTNGSVLNIGDIVKFENEYYPNNYLVDYQDGWAAVGTYNKPKYWKVIYHP